MTDQGTTSAPGAPLAGMRGRLSAVPRPPRVVMPEPVPNENEPRRAGEEPGPAGPEVSTWAGTDHVVASAGTREPPAGAASMGEGVPAAKATEVAASTARDRGAQDDSADGLGTALQGLLEAGQAKGFKRAVRDLYDDQGWGDGINMTWALPRAVRDTVARFGADADLANKRAASAVLYAGLLALGLEVRPNTPEEDRSVRRRT